MIKTAVFKIHNPSVSKQAALQKAFKNYHRLCDKLLNKVKTDDDHFFSKIGVQNSQGKIVYKDKKGNAVSKPLCSNGRNYTHTRSYFKLVEYWQDFELLKFCQASELVKTGPTHVFTLTGTNK